MQVKLSAFFINGVYEKDILKSFLYINIRTTRIMIMTVNEKAHKSPNYYKTEIATNGVK